MSRISSVSVEKRTEARELRLTGMSYVKIARQLDLTISEVRWATDGDVVRLHRRKPCFDNRHLGIFNQHPPRSVRRIVAEPECVLAAARAFAAGEISRSELMMRITP